MLKSFRRLLVIYKGYRLRLLFSQVLLLIAALCMIGVASLNQVIVNDGIVAENPEAILRTGFWMFILAAIAGFAMAGTAYFAVFFAQGTGYIIRVELYKKIQTFSFSNFDRFRTGNLMVRLNADVNNIVNAVMYSVMLAMFAVFMILIALVMTLIFAPSMAWVLILVIVVVVVLMAILVPQIFRAYDERQQPPGKSGRGARGQGL